MESSTHVRRAFHEANRKGWNASSSGSQSARCHLVRERCPKTVVYGDSTAAPNEFSMTVSVMPRRDRSAGAQALRVPSDGVRSNLN